MRSFRISAAADAAISWILEESSFQFGPEARNRHEDLFIRSLRDIAADPQRLGVTSLDSVAAGMRLYHLRFSRSHAAPPGRRVQKPRHMLLFKVSREAVEVLDVLHERMNVDAAARRAALRPTETL